MAKYEARKVEDELNDNHYLVTKTNDDGTVIHENVYLSSKSLSANGGAIKRAIEVYKEAMIAQTREI